MTSDPNQRILEAAYQKAADAIRDAHSLVITAGAGMGVDSGLPDFRGDTGFWQAYPLYQKLQKRFVEMATPRHFSEDPSFGWGFYGHRTNLYRDTVPHSGFSILQDWIQRFNLRSFVVTSNVDGQFQKAGFDEQSILEVHGSIHRLQCQDPCKPLIWDNDEDLEIDFETMRSSTIPKCRYCAGPARPNVLMFNDWSWLPARTDLQQSRFDRFIADCAQPLVVVELGAGTAIPTIRFTSERLGRRRETTVIRINPREPKIDTPHLSIPLGAAHSLQQIDQLLTN